MTLAILLECKPFVTEFARKRWLASGVCTLVGGQVARCRKWSVTGFALVRWLASGVGALVINFSGRPGKPFDTEFAFEGFFSSVSELMMFQSVG